MKLLKNNKKMLIITNKQKEQVKKDLKALLEQKIKAENSIYTEKSIIDGITLQFRMFETLAIFAGVFDVIEIQINEKEQNG